MIAMELMFNKIISDDEVEDFEKEIKKRLKGLGGVSIIQTTNHKIALGGDPRFVEEMKKENPELYE